MVISFDDIRIPQQDLVMNPAEVSGTMDAKTQQTLRDFQRTNNLPATGVLDEKTAKNLGITVHGDGVSTPSQRQDSTMPRSNSSTPPGTERRAQPSFELTCVSGPPGGVADRAPLPEDRTTS